MGFFTDAFRGRRGDLVEPLLAHELGSLNVAVDVHVRRLTSTMDVIDER